MQIRDFYSEKKYTSTDNSKKVPVRIVHVLYVNSTFNSIDESELSRTHLLVYLQWPLAQRNRRSDQQRVIAILKLRMEKLIQQKRSELFREIETLQNALSTLPEKKSSSPIRLQFRVCFEMNFGSIPVYLL